MKSPGAFSKGRLRFPDGPMKRDGALSGHSTGDGFFRPGRNPAAMSGYTDAGLNAAARTDQLIGAG
jgi:hypothetical protein